MIGQSNQDEQFKGRDNMIRRGTSSDDLSNPSQGIYPQVDVNTLDETIVSKIRSEKDNVMTTVETGVQDPVLTAIEILVITRVELAMKPANASSEQSLDGNVLDGIFWVLTKA